MNASGITQLAQTDMQTLRETAQNMAAFWGSVEATQDPARRAQLIALYSEQLVHQSNVYATLMQKNGLQGPFAK